MGKARPPSSPIRFATFEVDLDTGELRRNGKKLTLQEQPFQVLAALLERPGQLVTRDELQHKVWASDTFVDFERGINKAINRLREALGDSAQDPAFIETLPRRGYRFIGPIEQTIRSVAVLPLEHQGGDQQFEYWVDGMTDELINHLGKAGGLTVISRTSVMRFKRGPLDLHDIARQLSVDAFVEGSVMITGQHVRIRVQFIGAATDSPLWAESYDGELTDAARLQERVAEDIARHVRSHVALDDTTVSGSVRRPVSDVAYEAYLKGRFFWNKRTEADIKRGVEYFKQATALAPEYSLAYCGLADSYILMGIFALCPPHEAYPLANIAAEQALRCDRDLPEAHAASAMVRLLYDWDWRGAERQFSRAIELNSNYSIAHQYYAYLLAVLGRHDEAITHVNRARDLDPLSLPINAFVGFMQMKAGRYSEAIEAGHRAIELDPRHPFGHWMVARALDACDQCQEALVESEMAASLSGNSQPYAAHLGYAQARSGDHAAARRVLARLTELSRQKYISPYDLAVVCAALGDQDDAFTWLEKAYEQRIPRLTEITDPAFKTLRRDPRLRVLADRIGLPWLSVLES